MSGRIRVLIWYRCPYDKLDSFIETFHAISTQLAGVPGLLRSDLLQARREEGSLVVMSEWESAQAFATWEASPRHNTANLRDRLVRCGHAACWPGEAADG